MQLYWEIVVQMEKKTIYTTKQNRTNKKINKSKKKKKKKKKKKQKKSKRTRNKISLGGDISLTYLRNMYKWELGSSKEETYYYNNFYETHSNLHFNRKWERYNRHTLRLYSFKHNLNQCCVLVILMQEIFPKENGNKVLFPSFLNMVLIYFVCVCVCGGGGGRGGGNRTELSPRNNTPEA